MKEKYICIHGHFYQPPRENPWLEEIELQDGAYPYHDWNEKIAAECYATNAASRILEPRGRIINIVNNYATMSFNFGPTLLSWMEKHKPEIYEDILDADRVSIERFSGHGSAISQVYNHIIMPLANKRDKYTQVKWGVRDFEKRFGRFPEGMWLPETAVDLESLEVLAEFGIRFTILSPTQAKRVRKREGIVKWEDVSVVKVDTTMPYLCILPSGRVINLFFYNDPISRDASFGNLLNSGEGFAKRLISAFAEDTQKPQLVNVATDGETFGHHHRFGDMALAYCLHFIQSNNLAIITNYGEYLEKHPPTHLVEILENSSWSCVHGVERWRSDCGCNSGKHPGWTQAWREPLREAMDGLRDRIAPLYEEEASRYLEDPWEARDSYIDVISDRSRENTKWFFEQHATKPLSTEGEIRVLKLLEMQRNAMLMFTSCGWFFDEMSGIETTQIMRYAARTMQLAEELSNRPIEEEYLSVIEKARTNIPELANGRKVYEEFVKPAMLNLIRVAADQAIFSLFEECPEIASVYSYTASKDACDLMEAGRLRLAIGKSTITSDITWEEERVAYVVLHLGDHNVNGGSRHYTDEEGFSIMYAEIKEAFDRGDVPELIKLIDKHFGVNNYSLRHLVRDEQRKVLNHILSSTLDEVELLFRHIYEENYTIMNFLQGIGMPFPKPFVAATEFVLNRDMKEVLEAEKPDLDKLESLIDEVTKWVVEIDKPTLGFAASSMVNTLMEDLIWNPEDLLLLRELEHTLRLLNSLQLDLDLSRSQNIYFKLGQDILGAVEEKGENGEEGYEKWLEAFHKLGRQLHVKVRDGGEGGGNE